LEADPRNADAAANLGATLANLGRLEDAQRQLGVALALDDGSVFAHLSLGVVHDRLGHDQAALEQYTATLARDPANLQGTIYLADLEMRMGRADEAAKLYRQALERSPNLAGVPLALALAYVKGGRHADARAVLEAAESKQPGSPEITNALARILATAPQRSVRDGPRAVALAKELFETARHPELGQTYAMALAETGQYEHAASLQKEVIVVTERMGNRRRTPFLERNLALYRERKPAREGWAQDDPLFAPRRPAVQLAKKG
jgi:tetratricopeptide (TPR) repeat protein